MLKRFVFAVLVLWTTHASATVRVGPRYDWFHSGGYFHAVAGGGGAWTETLNGVETFYFVQTARNDAYVELFDSSRALYVRLYPDSMYLLAAGEPAFHKWYDGHWDDRRLYNYLSAGQPAYFSLGVGELWRWARQGEPIVLLRETLRNDDQIQLYNAQQGYTISLMDNQFWMKMDGYSWFKYADGAFN